MRGNGRNNLFGKHVSICPFNQIGIEVPNTQCRTPISRASEHKRGNVADISGVEKAEPDAVVRHIRPCRQQTLFCRSCKIWHYSPGQRITAPCKAIESSRLGWSCVSTSDSRSSGAQAVSPNAPGPPSIRGRCRSTRTVRRSSRPEYSRSGCCRRQHLRDDRSSRLSLMAILSSMLLGTANHEVACKKLQFRHDPLFHRCLTYTLAETVSVTYI